MQTQEGSCLAFLSSAGTYKEDAFQRDLQAIQAVYLEKGYVERQGGQAHHRALAPTGTTSSSASRVEEGEQYDRGKARLLGRSARAGAPPATSSPGPSEASSSSAPRSAHDLRGDPTSTRTWATPTSTWTRHQARPRHPDAWTSTFDVQPGEKVRFERIEIVGNDKTRDKVIRRELRIYEGELFSASGIKMSKHRVTALGYFETVEISTRQGQLRRPHRGGGRGEGEGHRHLPGRRRLLLLRELRPHRARSARTTSSAGARPSRSSCSGPRSGSWARSSSSSRTSSTRKLDLRLRHLRQREPLLHLHPGALGGSLTWGYELAGLSWLWPGLSKLEDLRLFPPTRYEAGHVATRSACASATATGSGTTSAAPPLAAWDRRDNRLFPTSGCFVSASLETAPPFLAPERALRHQVNLFNRYTPRVPLLPPAVLAGLIGRFRLLAACIRGWTRPTRCRCRSSTTWAASTPSAATGSTASRPGGSGPAPTPAYAQIACSRWAATSSWS